MATSAFKSTTKRTSSLGDSPAHRRSRSLSRFSHPVTPSDEPRGKFVNTVRGSGFPEITLDDLSIQLPGHRSGARSESRNDDVDSSRSRRGRSVSRRVGDGKGSGRANYTNGRVNSESVSRRRRSVSVVRYHQEVSDCESDLDHSRSSDGSASTKNFAAANGQQKVLDKTATPNHRPGLRRSFSQKDFKYHDGYSSHSSALTDDEARDAYNGKNGTERTIRTVYTTKKADHPTVDDTSSGLYEAMRKELRNAVEEIRTELEQTRGTTAVDDYGKYRNSDAHQAVSNVKSFARKMEQFEKSKHELLAEILLEEQHGRKLPKAVKKLLPDSNNAAAERPSGVRKKSSDRTRMSKRLTEEAERYFEDFISNVEDTDISSLDGERSSDTSSSLGGTMKMEKFQSPIILKSLPVEMDGVVLPWLQWETSNDNSPFSSNNTALATTPKTKLLSATELKSRNKLYLSHNRLVDNFFGAAAIQDLSYQSVSSHGSWSTNIMDRHSTNFSKVAGSKFMELDSHSSEKSSGGSHFDVDEYLNRQSVEEFLHERWMQQQRIYSGSLLLCNQRPFNCYPSF